MTEIKRIAMRKEGNNWKETYTETNETMIYKSLAYDLRAHYIWHAGYIKKIIDHNNYDGTRTITVFYDNNIKNIYIVK